MVRKNPEDDPSNKYRYRQSDLYKDYMNRLDFEHELINRRVTCGLSRCPRYNERRY